MSTSVGSGQGEEVERLQQRVEVLEHERKHLLAVIEILQEIAGSLHFVDIVQAVARRLGETFGLDRCSIFRCTTPPMTIAAPRRGALCSRCGARTV